MRFLIVLLLLLLLGASGCEVITGLQYTSRITKDIECAPGGEGGGGGMGGAAQARDDYLFCAHGIHVSGD